MSLTSLLLFLAPLTTSDAVSKGHSLPDFTLQAHQGERLSLSDLELNWVVLIFLDSTEQATSAKLATSLQRNHYEFKDAGIKVVAIADQPTSANKAWAQRHQLTFPILSDVQATVAKRYFATSQSTCCTVLLVDPMGLLAEQLQATPDLDLGEVMLQRVHARTRTITISNQPGQ